MKQPTKYALIPFLLFALLGPGHSGAHSTATEQSNSALSAEQLQAAIIREVEDYLEQRARTLGLTPTIEVAKPRVEHLASCAKLAVQSNETTPLRARMTVSVRCEDPARWVSHVHAQLSADGFYFTTNRTIEAGEPISLDDLIAHETDVLKISPHVVTDPSQIIGHIATRRLPSGSTVRANGLRHPQSVARGQQVQTIVHGAGFTVTGKGQAVQAGNPGSRIQVRTPTGQLIQGIVLDAHTVEVMAF